MHYSRDFSPTAKTIPNENSQRNSFNWQCPRTCDLKHFVFFEFSNHLTDCSQSPSATFFGHYLNNFKFILLFLFSLWYFSIFCRNNQFENSKKKIHVKSVLWLCWYFVASTFQTNVCGKRSECSFVDFIIKKNSLIWLPALCALHNIATFSMINTTALIE